MIRAMFLLMVVAATCIAGACQPIVGAPCTTPPQPGTATEVISPALDCPSRACLRYQGGPGLCTAQCQSDSDCNKTGRTCDGKFVCAVATVQGDMCCKKLCICSDFFFTANREAPSPPAACDPSEAMNACCNLDGRKEDPRRYPQCRG